MRQICRTSYPYYFYNICFTHFNLCYSKQSFFFNNMHQLKSTLTEPGPRLFLFLFVLKRRDFMISNYCALHCTIKCCSYVYTCMYWCQKKYRSMFSIFETLYIKTIYIISNITSKSNDCFKSNSKLLV